MRTILALIQPFDTATNARVDVRVGDSPSPIGLGLGGFEWEAAFTQRPTLTMELTTLDMKGGVFAAKLSFVLQLRNIANVPGIVRKDFQGAPILLWSCDELAWGRRKVEFTGFVSSATLDPDMLTISLECDTSTRMLRVPFLWDHFDGTGGVGGDASFRGTPKPAGIGPVKGVEPIWFDPINNIGMVDGYGNLISVQRLLEGASAWGAPVDDYANYAALAAAIVAKVVRPGQWATCIAQGLIGLGAPPHGVIMVDCTFGYGTPGTAIPRILENHAGIPAGEIDLASMAAVDAALQALFGGAVPAIGYWTKDQRQVDELVAQIAGGGNASILVSPQGLITISRPVSSAPVATLDRSGSVDPRVINWKSAGSVAPYYLLKARAARPARVLTRNEVNFYDSFVPLGIFNVATVYQSGNTVFKTDGSEWLYINATAAAGHTPPAATYPPAAFAADAWWQQIGAGSTYADGTPIDNLKPQEVGANKTETRTAAAIASQGTLATLNNAALGSTGQVVRQDGTTKVTDATAITSLGTAAAIAGQGTLATANQVNLGSTGTVYRQDAATHVTDATAITSLGTAAAIAGQGALATQGSVYFDGGFIKESLGGADATLSNFKTSSGTAAAIASQGALATLSQVQLGATGRVYRDDGTTRLTDALAVTSLGTAAAIASQGSYATLSQTYFGDGLLKESSGGSTATLANFKTSLGTASAIASQGALATLSQVQWGSSGRVYRDDGVTRVTDASSITSLGTAAAIAGQGSYATLSQTYFGDGLLKETSGGVTATLANFKTSSGTAAAIAGQGTLATRSTARLGTELVDASGNILTASRVVTNLVDLTHWYDGASALTIGASGAQPANITSAETYVTVVGPSGESEVALKATTDASGSAQQGGFYVLVDAGGGLDPKRSHRVSFFAKVDDVTAASSNLYFGPPDTAVGQEAVTSLAGVADPNPYFGAPFTPPSTGKWYLYVGVVHGSAYAGADSGLSGIYDPVVGARVASGQDYKWRAGTTKGGMRAFRYYGEVGKSTLFTRLTVAEISGEATGIQAMLGTPGARAGSNLLRTDGVTVMTQAEVRTSEGTASAIASQGALATLSQVQWGSSGRVYRDDGVTRVTDASSITSLGTAAAIAGQGALAVLNSVDPSTSQVKSLGSIPPTVPDNSFSYTSTTSSITITWPNITIYRADGTTISVSTSSTSVSSGLAAGTTYKVYPYVVDNGTSSGTMSFAAGGTGVGSPAMMYASSGSAAAAAAMAARGNIPLNGFAAATTASGTGGGGGGGSACFHERAVVETSRGFIKWGKIRVGDFLAGPGGWARVVEVRRKKTARWIGVSLDQNTKTPEIVHPSHVFYRATGEPVQAELLKLGDLLHAAGDHREVTGLRLLREQADRIEAELEDPHLYYGGRAKLLSHNPKP